MYTLASTILHGHAAYGFHGGWTERAAGARRRSPGCTTQVRYNNNNKNNDNNDNNNNDNNKNNNKSNNSIKYYYDSRNDSNRGTCGLN